MNRKKDKKLYYYGNKTFDEIIQECEQRYKRRRKMTKFKKILTEIVKVGGWIIVALQELLKVM